MLKHARPSHAPESSSSLSVGRAEPPLVSPALPSLPPTPPPKDYFRPLALDDRDAPGPSSEPISHVSGVKRTSIDTPKASDVFSHHTLTPKVSRPNLKRADAFAPTSFPQAPESPEIARNTTPVETHSHIGLVARPSSSNSAKKAALRAASTNHPTHHLSPPTKRRPRRASLPSSFLSSRSREPPPPLPTTTTNSNNNTSTNPIIRLKHPTLEPPLSLDILVSVLLTMVDPAADL
ncbi:hypothetical protein DL93DRAFT_2081930 [Clavulina sp. PMI_390]|nr:hypothetical protein DL93DRAFT_2081930 [Clavulina sp. PMI_390]